MANLMGGRGSDTNAERLARRERILAQLKAGKSQVDIAKQEGVTRAAISQIWRAANPDKRFTPRRRYHGSSDNAPTIEDWIPLKIQECLNSQRLMLEESQRERVKHVFWSGPDAEQRRRLERIADDCAQMVLFLQNASKPDAARARKRGLLEFLNSKIGRNVMRNITAFKKGQSA